VIGVTVEEMLEQRAAEAQGMAFMGRCVAELSREQLLGAIVVLGELRQGEQERRFKEWREFLR